MNEFMTTVKEQTKAQMVEMPPATYTWKMSYGIACQALIIKLTKKRFPRFAKGYTIWCVICHVLSLGYYVHLKKSEGVLTQEHEYVYGDIELSMHDKMNN